MSDILFDGEFQTQDSDGIRNVHLSYRVLVNSRKPVIFSGCEAQSCRLLVLKKKKKKKKKKALVGLQTA